MNGALEFRHCVTNDIDNTGMRATIIFGELLAAIRDVSKINNIRREDNKPFPCYIYHSIPFVHYVLQNKTGCKPVTSPRLN